MGAWTSLSTNRWSYSPEQVISARPMFWWRACSQKGCRRSFAVNRWARIPSPWGRMAVTEILVPDDEFESATALLEELAIEATSTEVEPAGFGGSPASGTSFMWWLVAAVLVATMIWVRLSHYL